MNLRFAAATIATLVATTHAAAQVKPRAEDLPRGFRTLAGVELNRDSALSVFAKLGPARERRVGSGHDFYRSWCYLIKDAGAPIVLELLSDASDMGTSGHAVNVIRLRSGASSLQRKQCSLLVSHAPLTTAAGLRLGLTRKEVQAQLGVPTGRFRDSLVFEFESKEYMKKSSPTYAAWNTPERRKNCFGGGEPFSNVGAAVMVLFRNERAVEIRLERFDQSTC
jgi:hypothetical protein